MVLTRAFDAKAVALQRTGRLGTYPSCLGQEVVAVGIGAAMARDDVERVAKTLAAAGPAEPLGGACHGRSHGKGASEVVPATMPMWTPGRTARSCFG